MNPTFRHITCLGVTLLSISSTSLHALVIRDYANNPDRYNRFTGFAASPVHNPNFMHAAYDLTGVGWHTATAARQLTMVSPIHFVGANHYKPGVGATIRFLASDGSVKDYIVASQASITNDDGLPSDLFYGTLSAPIPDSDQVNYHPYLNLGSERFYRRKSLIILGKNALGASETLSVITDISSASTNSTRVLRWEYTTASGASDDAYLETGDSGSPVFINQDGIAAIVGTNSLVSSNATTVYNYSNFIPYYADKLDTAMEAQGYHMTKAIPGSTTLTLTHTPPVSLIRAGHDFTINLTLHNTGGTLADNIKLQNSFSNGATVNTASGTDWFDESEPTLTKARISYLDASASCNYSITLNISSPGIAQQQVVYSADQFSSTTESFNLDVIESYISWTSALADKTSEGDDDSDGIGNLLEYAFGGDPTASSQTLPGTTTNLLPSYDGTTISYIRRTDYTDRALSYVLKSSTTLQGGSWSDAASQSTTSPINSDFELVTLTLTPTGTERFFRIEVTLSE